MLSVRENCDPTLPVLARAPPPPLFEFQDVGGIEGLDLAIGLRGIGGISSSSWSVPLLCDRERVDDLRDDVDFCLERLSVESRRVRGDGASSSSLSLHPRPVVNPIPAFNCLPSLWRTRRCGVSRWSLKRPDFVIIETSLQDAEFMYEHDKSNYSLEAMLIILSGLFNSCEVGALLDPGKSLEWGDKSPCLNIRYLEEYYDQHKNPVCKSKNSRQGGMQINTRIRITPFPVKLRLRCGIDIDNHPRTEVIVLIKWSPVIFNI